jgi:hypothetical protein
MFYCIVIVVNVLLSLIYKFNFITGMCVCKNNIGYFRVGSSPSFRHPLVALGISPKDKNVLLYSDFRLIILFNTVRTYRRGKSPAPCQGFEVQC